MDTKELLKKVRKIEIKTKGLSSQVFSGEYHSAFKGKGMTFSEVREYVHGDDVRNIDWNVTARFGAPHVKVFEEERELTVMLLVDMSASLNFGSGDQTKKELIAELCAIVAFSATQNNDKIGALLFTEDTELFIPPAKGRKHILRIIREIIELEPKGKQTNISEALRHYTNVIKKRSIGFLISDFGDTDFEQSLKVANQRHDLIAFNVYDKYEQDLPKMGLVPFFDLETGKEYWINTGNKKVRTKHKANFLKKQDELNTIFRKNGVDYLSLETDKSYVKSLINLFKNR